MKYKMKHFTLKSLAGLGAVMTLCAVGGMDANAIGCLRGGIQGFAGIIIIFAVVIALNMDAVRAMEARPVEVAAYAPDKKKCS